MPNKVLRDLRDIDFLLTIIVCLHLLFILPWFIKTKHKSVVLPLYRLKSLCLWKGLLSRTLKFGRSWKRREFKPRITDKINLFINPIVN